LRFRPGLFDLRYKPLPLRLGFLENPALFLLGIQDAFESLSQGLVRLREILMLRSQLSELEEEENEAEQ